MKDIAFVKPGIYRFTLWYGNLNGRTLICKENYMYIYYLFDAHCVFCYARSFTSFGCQNFILYLSLALVKVNPRLIASDDICERSVVVFRELFQHLFCNSHPSKFLFFCNEMGYPSGTYPSHFCITPENCMSNSYWDTNAFSYMPSCKSCICSNQICYFFNYFLTKLQCSDNVHEAHLLPNLHHFWISYTIVWQMRKESSLFP